MPMFWRTSCVSWRASSSRDIFSTSGFDQFVIRELGLLVLTRDSALTRLQRGACLLPLAFSPRPFAGLVLHPFSCSFCCLSCSFLKSLASLPISTFQWRNATFKPPQPLGAVRAARGGGGLCAFEVPAHSTGWAALNDSAFQLFIATMATHFLIHTVPLSNTFLARALAPIARTPEASRRVRVRERERETET